MTSVVLSGPQKWIHKPTNVQKNLYIEHVRESWDQIEFIIQLTSVLAFRMLEHLAEIMERSQRNICRTDLDQRSIMKSLLACLPLRFSSAFALSVKVRSESRYQRRTCKNRELQRSGCETIKTVITLLLLLCGTRSEAVGTTSGSLRWDPFAYGDLIVKSRIVDVRRDFVPFADFWMHPPESREALKNMRTQRR